MNVGDYVFTPRFLTVRISDVFSSATAAQEAGYVEPTHYMGTAAIYGKSLDPHHMAFAAIVRDPSVADDEPPF